MLHACVDPPFDHRYMDFASVDKPRRECPRYTRPQSTIRVLGCITHSWLAFDFRCLHARQAVEAFRDRDDAGGEPTRVPTPAGEGARGGGPGRDGDMAGEFACLIV